MRVALLSALLLASSCRSAYLYEHEVEHAEAKCLTKTAPRK